MAKSHCLIILSAAPQGVEASSFIQSFKVLHPVFNIQLASPNGSIPDFKSSDEHTQRWIADFKGKPYSSPVRLESVDETGKIETNFCNCFTCVIVSSFAFSLKICCSFHPRGFGALFDLVHSLQMQSIINHFTRVKKPICAIGCGVAGLCGLSLTKSIPWSFDGFSLTSTSIAELAKKPMFGTIPLLVEDFVKQNGGIYSASEPGEPHVIIDRFLITGQNEASTVTAVQNLILLCNLRQTRHSSSSH
ncbi:putative Parkinson disease 7 domain-containing protein 1-like [Apostichopus japonicus]|uniref:Glutamine amidotransferase-like class 1 domain-containing protein 1 n=1 Tax=Stichopus japonicus TaxID=307972 RepID=A0A2G8JPZ7_STIJA|nr:putative Parkinson disease 7 domain-containing protein 1-like [Apostichopus japonicus]